MATLSLKNPSTRAVIAKPTEGRSIQPRQLKRELRSRGIPLKKPFAVGITKHIRTRCPDIGIKQLQRAMRVWTRSTPYLTALVESPWRYDVDGNIAGPVAPEHRAGAAQALEKRHRCHKGGGA